MPNPSFKSNILYNLAKITKGKSSQLYSFFGLAIEDYEKIIPSTKLQKTIYVDSLINTDRSAYNVAQWIQVDGNIDTSRWNHAIYLLTDQESVMRTVFVEKEGLVYQATKKQVSPDFNFIDLSEEKFSQEALTGYIHKIVDKVFVLDPVQPCFRHYLIKVKDGCFRLVYVSHQLCHDIRCSKVFFERVFRIYKKLELGQIISKSDSDNFEQYVFYNNDFFDAAPTKAFWQDRLNSCQPLYPNSYQTTRTGAFVAQTKTISPEHVAAIQDFCRLKGVNMAFYFKALINLLINKQFSPDSNFVFYENVHGRSKEYFSTLGLFFHPVPVMGIKPECLALTFSEYLSFLDNHWQEEISFSEISSEGLAGLPFHNGLKFYYNYLSQGIIRTAFGNVVGNVVENRGNSDEVQLIVENKKNLIDLILTCHSSFFNASFFLERLVDLSDQLLMTPGIKINEICYLPQVERDLIDGFNSDFENLDDSFHFNTRFEEQVAKSPQAIALSFNDLDLTYQELHRQSSNLARYMRDELRVSKGDVIGVYLERSHLSIVAIIAIFQIGGVYLPLDFNLPKDRLDYIINHAKPKLCLVKSESGLNTENFSTSICVIDSLVDKLQEDVNEFFSGSSILDIAYLIYTSGSTGVPKGVIVEHQGMSNHLFEKIRQLEINSTSVIAQTANVGFDISIWQFLCALLTGGKTQIYSDSILSDIPEVSKLFLKDKVSIVELVPSMLAMYLNDDSFRRVKPFNKICFMLVTGDVVATRLAEIWFEEYPDIPLVNAFGPTEASDDITHHFMKGENQYSIVPIGSPIVNARIYIVDSKGNLCGIGQKGEIWVAGICVGRGYMHDAVENNSAFVQDPFVDGPCRLFKTGDIGSWLPNGTVLFHGRKDSQLKIRGNRIELGEIEIIIRQYRQIVEVVVLPEKIAEETALIAYLEVKASFDLSALKNYLNRKIPAYMIPSTFRIVEKWPVTMNGKIDRNQLPKMAETEHCAVFRDAKDPVEKRLAVVWSSILGVEKISVDDDFFELGGHSLRGMQLIARIHEEYQLKFELKTIYSHPTIEALASLINSKLWLNTESSEGNGNELYL